MIGASIGALVKNDADGVIVLNEDFTVNWYDILYNFPKK